MAQAAVADVPRICAELRDYFALKTGKQDDPVIERLTTHLEMISAVRPEPVNGTDLYGLTFTEERIFRALAENPDRTMSRQSILNAAYFDRARDEPDEKIMDVFILKIRRKLFAADARCWIEPVHGVGFKLVSRRAREARPEWMKA